jgi:hypothetical protein
MSVMGNGVISGQPDVFPRSLLSDLLSVTNLSTSLTGFCFFAPNVLAGRGGEKARLSGREPSLTSGIDH